MDLLRLHAVEKTYWRGTAEILALREVTLAVNAREVVAIYGERGAGKTTLLKVAAGFARPDSGSVRFRGDELGALSRRRLARLHREQLGWVDRAGPHSAELPMRVHLALALYRELGPADAERRAVRALARVGAADCADERWDDLSDTARALVGLAHALVREPQLLVLDDPLAGLGIVDREQVLGLLREAAEDGGLGVLLAVPDMPSLLHAHHVRALSRGRLLAPSDDTDAPGAVLQFPRRRRTA